MTSGEPSKSRDEAYVTMLAENLDSDKYEYIKAFEINSEIANETTKHEISVLSETPKTQKPEAVQLPHIESNSDLDVSAAMAHNEEAVQLPHMASNSHRDVSAAMAHNEEAVQLPHMASNSHRDVSAAMAHNEDSHIASSSSVSCLSSRSIILPCLTLLFTIIVLISIVLHDWYKRSEINIENLQQPTRRTVSVHYNRSEISSRNLHEPTTAVVGNLSHGKYFKIINKNLKLRQTFTKQCNDLILVNRDVWCIAEHDISMYNTSTLQITFELSHSHTRHMRAVTLADNGDLIIACAENYGLHLLTTKNGHYISTNLIKQASFRDVCFRGSKIYALSETNRKKVTILTKTHSWQVLNIVELKLGIALIHAVNEHVYVAFMDDKKQVGVYDVDMKMVNSVNFERGWHVVGVDDVGCFMAYPAHKKSSEVLKLYIYVGRGIWKELPMTLYAGSQTSAVLVDTSNQQLWIAHIERKLNIFTYR